MNGPYTFKVEYYNEFDNKVDFHCGVLFADNYAEAAGKLQRYYGNTLICIHRLFEMEEDPVVILDEETIKKIESDEFREI